jgi:predicted CXXCH cytochrome family protein
VIRSRIHGLRFIAAVAVFACSVPLALAGTAGAAASALTAPTNDACFRCHGRQAGSFSVVVDGQQRSTFVDEAVYDASQHGELACTSCHLGFKSGPHTADQTRDWLVTAELTACRNCHADVFAMYRGSFHGDLVFGKSGGNAPVCADCHEAHDILPPGTPAFRASIDALCARCHESALKTYLGSYHGKAFFLGDAKTAVCTDCHGGHRILPPSDPASTVSKQNLVATCAQCHPGANENFAGFMVHVDPRDPRSSLVVWSFYSLYIILIAVVFTFGATHTALYIYRGIKDGLYSRRRSG